MSEVTFAKQFLATIDKKPIKLPADHVSDPRQYPNQSPYILPRQTHPFPRRSGPTSSQQASSKTITATLKPMRNGETITLPSIALDTTIHDLKTQYASKTSIPQDKIKVLYNKKPVADLKTLKDIGIEGDAELSLMIMGGGGGTPRAQSPAVTAEKERVPVPDMKADSMDVDEKTSAPESEKATAEAEEKKEAQGAAAILKTDEFWADLGGFLSQRLRDDEVAARLLTVFKSASKQYQ
ncbi:hypothetical protein DOTSEDRAFT_53942 [Dothistroma septosporum NZE10]|uniref:Ubiquitin-like domain-containing protein n=1 Tax=Dothistroma septosporum (strain NZE10 / CBS 128990) TaxID=675120 RepID=M2YM75_DOTSN|nr:hypothetical protein DOTSEDRAFT_53942 [Dothistroma septosporum NZE10]